MGLEMETIPASGSKGMTPLLERWKKKNPRSALKTLKKLAMVG